MNLSLLDLRFFFKYPRDKRKDESCVHRRIVRSSSLHRRILDPKYRAIALLSRTIAWSNNKTVKGRRGSGNYDCVCPPLFLVFFFFFVKFSFSPLRASRPVSSSTIHGLLGPTTSDSLRPRYPCISVDEITIATKKPDFTLVIYRRVGTVVYRASTFSVTFEFTEARGTPINRGNDTCSLKTMGPDSVDARC